MVPTLDIRDLALVREVAGAGSVTRAGARLHLTQSALSHRLRAAESRLGTPLFLRVGKKMIPTPAGERVLDVARRVLDDLERTENDVRTIGHEHGGLLRLSTQCYTGYHWLPPLLSAFQARHPQVDVQIAVDATYRPVDALLAGEIDLAVLTRAAKDRRLHLRPLFQDEMLAVVSPAHPFAKRAFVEPADFASEHLITYLIDRRESFLFREILEPAGVTPAKISRVPLTEAMLEMVKAGLGVAVLERWAVAPALDSGAVRAVRITRRGIIRQWSVATLRSAGEPQWRTDFIELLRTSAPVRPGAPMKCTRRPGLYPRRGGVNAHRARRPAKAHSPVEPE